MIYTVSYTLIPKRDATRLMVELQKSAMWLHALDDSWVIATTESALTLWNRLVPYLTQTDRVLIAEFPKNASFQGWMTKEAWDWIDKMRLDYG